MDKFFRTRMGQLFFEATMPKIADELARLNRNLEALVLALKTPPSRPADPSPSDGADNSQQP